MSCRWFVIVGMCAFSGVLTFAQDRAARPGALDPRTAAIEQALETTTNMEFPANPLNDVVQYLSEFHKFPVLLDVAELSDAGVAPDQEISLVISGVILRNALELLLDNVGGVQLDYVIQHQVLMITTRRKADRTVDTRVYNMRSLDSAGLDSYSVANVIRKSIEPASWAHIEIAQEQAEAGMSGMMGAPGPGMGSRMMPAGGLGEMYIDRKQSSGLGTIEALPGCLVVTQSQRVHRAVADLLTQLRSQADGESGGQGAPGFGFGVSGPSAAGAPFYSPSGGLGTPSAPGAGVPGVVPAPANN
jgi:hypothetical protein